MIEAEKLDTLDDAITFAVLAHHKQIDKLGEAYILHPLRVMLMIPAGTLEQQMAAVLHDVVEDTKATLQEIENLFGSKVSSLVDSLTRREDEDYFIYIFRLKDNPDAMVIKKLDLLDNMSRLPQLSEHDPDAARRLREKYSKAVEMLQSPVAQE